MKWTSSKLKNFIKSALQTKNRVTLQDGNITKATNEVLTAIANGIATVHGEWQDNAKINNIIVNGGTCTPLGPLALPATGIALTGCIQLKIKAKQIESEILSYFPGKNIVELTGGLKSLAIAASSGFANTYNQWLDLLVINNIIVSGGTCTCQSPPLSPIGTYSNGTGQLPILEGNLSTKIQQKVLKQNITLDLKSQVKLDESGNITKHLQQFVDAITQGIMDMYNQWLIGTQIQNIQVNGGVSVFAGPLSGAQGIQGELK